MVSLAEILGDRAVAPTQAVTFLTKWFDPGDVIVISGMVPKTLVSGLRPKIESVRIPVEVFVQQLSGEDSENILASLCKETDLYFTIAPAKPNSGASKGGRLTEEFVDSVIGVTCDLDVKDGAFTSQEQAMEYLGKLDIKPSIVVATGSGGLHCYWKLDERIPVSEGKSLTDRWWTYLEKIAVDNYNVHVDRLIDVVRMLRIPGSLRYPKVDGELVKQVRLLVYSDRVTSKDDLLKVSEQAYLDRIAMREQTKEREKTIAVPRSEPDAVNQGTSWQVTVAPEWVNENVSWEDILIPAGWTHMGENSVGPSAGSQLWIRPGGTQKSASVGWPQSPNVMSLLSHSADTGLADLKEAGVYLSKWRVVLRLFFNDDVEACTNWAVNLMRQAESPS